MNIMVNKNYKKGYVFELKIKHLLEDKGYYVMKSGGSHGIFDLIAFDDTCIYGLQLKNNCNLTQKEKEILFNLPVPKSFFKGIVIKAKNNTLLEFFGKQPEFNDKKKLIFSITSQRSVQKNDSNI